MAGIARGVRATGHPTRYIPSLTGDLDQLRAQASIARDDGLDCMMVAPMIAGFPAVQALMRALPRGGVLRPSEHGRRRPHRARTADRQAVSRSRLRRGDLSHLWRPLRLLAARADLPPMLGGRTRRPALAVPGRRHRPWSRIAEIT